MKVLKQPESNWSMNHTCDDCGAELEVEKQDVKCSYYAGDFREAAYYSYNAYCAVCGRPFSIAEDGLPKLLKLKLQAAAKQA